MSYNHFDDINDHLDKIRKSLSPYNIDVELLPGTKKNEVTGETNYTLRYTSQEGRERMRGILAAQKSKAERRDVDPGEITNEELRNAHNGYTYISEISFFWGSQLTGNSGNPENEFVVENNYLQQGTMHLGKGGLPQSDRPYYNGFESYVMQMRAMATGYNQGVQDPDTYHDLSTWRSMIRQEGGQVVNTENAWIPKTGIYLSPQTSLEQLRHLSGLLRVGFDFDIQGTDRASQDARMAARESVMHTLSNPGNGINERFQNLLSGAFRKDEDHLQFMMMSSLGEPYLNDQGQLVVDTSGKNQYRKAIQSDWRDRAMSYFQDSAGRLSPVPSDLLTPANTLRGPWDISESDIKIRAAYPMGGIPLEGGYTRERLPDNVLGRLTNEGGPRSLLAQGFESTRRINLPGFTNMDQLFAEGGTGDLDFKLTAGTLNPEENQRGEIMRMQRAASNVKVGEIPIGWDDNGKVTGTAPLNITGGNREFAIEKLQFNVPSNWITDDPQKWEQTWNRIVKANNLDTNVWSYGISRDENAIQIAATIFQETHTALKSLGTKGAPTASNPNDSQMWTIGGRSFDVLTENKNNVQAMWGSMEIMNRQQLSNLFGEAWGQAQGYSGKSKGLNFFAGISQEQIHNLQESLIGGTGNVDFSSVAKSIGAASTEALSGYLYDAVIRPDQPLVGNQVSRQQGLLDQFGIGRAIGDLAIDVYGSKSKEEFFENFYRDFTDTRWDEAATNQFNALNVGGTKVAAGFIQGADETEKRALAKQLFNSMYRWEDRQVVENRGEGIENRGDVQSTLISKNTEVLLADRQRGAVYEYAGLMKSFDARYALSLEAQGMPGIYSYLKTTQFASEDPALNALRQLRGARQIAEEAIEIGGNRSTPLENTGYQLGRTIGDKSVTARDMIDALESNAIKSPENGSSPEQAFSDWYNGRMAEMNMPVNSGVIWMPKSGLAIPNPALGLKTYAPGYSKGEDDRWTATSVNPVPGQLSGLMRRALDLEVGNVTPEELSEGTRDINKRMAGILQKITSGKELNQLEPAFGTSGRYAGNARVPENMVFLPDSELRRMMSVWGVRGMNTREFAETMNGMPALWNRAPTPSIGSTEHAGSIMPTYLMTSAHPIGREIQNDINQSHMQSAPIQINPFWMSMQGDLDFDPSSVMPIFDMQEVEENGEKKTQITDIRSNPGLMKEFESAVQNATSDRSQRFLYDVAFQGHEIGYKDPVADTLIPSYLYQMQLREERGEDTGLAEINRLSGEAIGDPDRFKNRRWLNEDKMKRYSQAIVGWNDMSAAGKEWDTNKNELMGKFFRTYQDRTISIGTALGASAGFIANALDYASLPYQTSVDFAGNPNEPLPNMVSSAHFAPVMKTGENNVRTPTGKWQLSAVVGSKQTKDGVTEDWQTLMDPSLSGMAGGSQEDFFGTVAGKLSGFASGNTHAMASWFASIVNGNPGATQQNWQTIKNELEPIYSQYAMGSTEREMAVKNAARGWYQRGVTGFNSIAPGMILSAAMTNTFVPGHTYSMRPEAFEAMQWYVGQFGDTQGQSGEYLVEHSPYALASELVDFRRNLSTNNYEKFDENGNPVFNGNEKLPNYLNMYNMVRAIRIADEQGITGPVYDQWRMNVPDQLGLTAGTTVQPPVVPQAPTPAPSSPSVVPNGSGPNGTVRPIVKNPSGTYTSNSATQTVFPGGAAQPRAPKSKRGRQSVGQTQGIPPEPPTSGDSGESPESGETPGNRLRLWNAQGEVNGYYEPPAFWGPGERPENVEGTPDLMQAIQALGEQISGAGDPSQYMIHNLLSINFGGPKTINAAARTTAAAIASGNASRMDDVRNKIGTELVQRIGQHYSIDTSGMTTTQAINAGIKADQAGANGFSEFIKANPDIHQAIIEANNAQRLSETIVNDRNKKYFWDKKTEAWGGTEAEATEAYRKQRVMAGQILTESGALDANVIRPNNPEDMITAEAYGAARLMSQVGIVRGKAKFPEPGDEYTSMDQKRYDNASANMDAMTKSLEKMNKALLDGNEVTQKKVAAEIDLNKARENRSGAELNLEKSVSDYEAEAKITPAAGTNLGDRTKTVITALEGKVAGATDLAEKKRLSDHATTIRQQSEFLAQAQSSEVAADAAYKVANMDSRTGEIYDLFDQNQYNSQRRYFGSMFAIQGALAGEVASGHSHNAARLSRQGEMLSANQKEYMAEQSLGQLINPLDGGGAAGSTIEQRAEDWLTNQAGVINGLTGDARRDAVDKQNRVFGALNTYRQAKGNTDSAVSAYAQLTSAIEKPDLMWDQYDRNRSLLMGDMLDDTNASYAAIAGVRGRPLATQREVAEARLRDQHTRLLSVENSMREIVEPWETATGNGPSNAQTPVGSAPGPTIGQRAQDMIVTLQAQLSGMSDSDPRKASLIKNLNTIQGFAQQHSTLSGEVGQSEADYNVANLRASLPGTEGWTQHHENIFQNNVSAADEYAKKVENINKAMKDGNEVMEKRTKLEAKKTELEDKQKNLGEVMGAEGADQYPGGTVLERATALRNDLTARVAAASDEQSKQVIAEKRGRVQGLIEQYQNTEGELGEVDAQQSQLDKTGGWHFAQASRRLLGGFGMMYLNSVAGIIAGPGEYGYSQGLERQQSEVQAIGSVFGGMALPTNYQTQLNNIAAISGGAGQFGLQSLQAYVEQQHPALARWGRTAAAGIAGAGATDFVLSQLLPASAEGAIGPIAIGAGILLAGASQISQAYGEYTDVQNQTSALAYQKFVNPNKTSWIGGRSYSSYYDNSSRITNLGPLNGIANQFGSWFAENIWGIPNTVASNNPETNAKSDLIVNALENYDKGNTDLTTALRQAGAKESDIPFYATQISQLKSQQNINIPNSAYAQVLAYQLQYGAKNMTNDQQNLMASAFAEGVDYTKVAGAVLSASGMTLTNIQNTGMQGIVNTILGNGGMTANQQATMLAGAQYESSFGSNINAWMNGNVDFSKMSDDQIKAWFQGKSAQYDQYRSANSSRQEAYQNYVQRQWTRKQNGQSGVPVNGIDNFTPYDVDTANGLQQYNIANAAENNLVYSKNQLQVQMGVMGLSPDQAQSITSGYTQGQVDAASQLLQQGASYKAAAARGGAQFGWADDIFKRIAGMSLPDQAQMMNMMAMNPIAIGSEYARGQLSGPIGIQNMQTYGENISMRDLMFTGFDQNTGQVSGYQWGRASLRWADKSPQQVAQHIWGGSFGANGAWSGNTNVSAGYVGAETNGITVAGTNTTLYGDQGGQYYQQQLSFQNQMANIGIQEQGLQLQHGYMTQSWGISQQQMNLGWAQQSFNLGMEQQQLNVQNKYWQQNFSMNVGQAMMQRGWTQQDWQYQDVQRTEQRQWQVEDFQENVRFMTGRERRLAERQMSRETTVYGQETTQIDKTRERQEEMWKLEDQRFDLEKKQHDEEKQMQQERIDKENEFFAQSKKLEQERFDLDKKYQLDQMDLQEQSIGIAANYAIEQNKINTAQILATKFVEDEGAKLQLINDKTFPGFLDFLDQFDLKLQQIEKDAGLGGGNGNGNGNSNGNSNGNGNGGKVPTAYTPAKTNAVTYSNPWNDPTPTRVRSGSQTQTVIIVNVGNETLGRFVVNALQKEISV